MLKVGKHPSPSPKAKILKSKGRAKTIRSDKNQRVNQKAKKKTLRKVNRKRKERARTRKDKKAKSYQNSWQNRIKPNTKNIFTKDIPFKNMEFSKQNSREYITDTTF